MRNKYSWGCGYIGFLEGGYIYGWKNGDGIGTFYFVDGDGRGDGKGKGNRNETLNYYGDGALYGDGNGNGEGNGESYQNLGEFEIL